MSNAPHVAAAATANLTSINKSPLKDELILDARGMNWGSRKIVKRCDVLCPDGREGLRHVVVPGQALLIGERPEDDEDDG
jgi:hypothetical protein